MQTKNIFKLFSALFILIDIIIATNREMRINFCIVQKDRFNILSHALRN